MTNETFSDVYNKALDLLSRREHSQKEVTLKLQKKFKNSEEIYEVIEKLVANNIINDTRFTEHYINLRKRRGFGSKKISYELLSKGINESIIDSTLSNMDDWKELAKKEFNKKYKDGPSDDFKIRSKQKNFLLNRGFSFEEIESVFG
jgi:regulatory protein